MADERKLTLLGKLVIVGFIAGCLFAAYRLWVGSGGQGWFPLRGRQTSSRAGTEATPAPGGTTASRLLRLEGSNTIGSSLAPALAERLLAREGAREVRRVAKGEEQSEVRATLPDGREAVIEIAARGSGTAFTALRSGAADIGLSSRRVTPAEKTSLAALGDLTSKAAEHVLGLDGLAVIVSSANPLEEISISQLRELFNGRIDDWRSLGGASGPVRRHARDERSGTWDTFRALVLHDAPLAPGAQRYEDSARLAAAVAADPGAVGFVGLPFVGACKALKVGEAGARPLRPTAFTVRTEDYPLTRRLYLYTPVASSNPWVSKFVGFALSAEGQAVVEAAGFFGQELQRSPAAGGAEERPEAPPEYRRLTSGAERLAVNFRFETGSNSLDTKAQRDIGRLVERLASSGQRRGLALIGFADALGEEQGNLRLSRERAQAVAEELRGEGVEPATVTGFGEALPVADNETDEGRQRNRRVEVWLRP